jgi:hypothetical protein
MQIYVEQNNFETWCYTVTEPNRAWLAACFLPSIALSHSLRVPLPSHFKNIVSYSSTY